jgi:uroporphyrinogen decarboxylase
VTILKPRDRFLAACRTEEVDMTPVWFMRQAGRYLPGYMEVRKSHTIIEICKTPKICEEVTLMPVVELGVDAAVMFGDIMLPLEGIGVDFHIEENLGPVIRNPIRGREDADRLRKFSASKDVPFMLEAIARVKSRLAKQGTALLGFSGAPFTIASYMIEGQATREFTRTKKLMFDDSDTWRILMSKLTEMVSDYLCAQIESGVDAVQLFDSWIGTLTAMDYEKFVFPFVAEIFKRVKNEYPHAPTIYFGTNTFHLLNSMRKAGGDVLSIDWRTPINTARQILGKSTSVQGNLEPAVLLSNDIDGFIKERTQAVLDDNDERPGHVFNLGHGILRETPVPNAKFVVDYVHKNS